jgi:thiosulfate/3-mercaptopyruvate sulfurtransferase
LSVLLPGSLAVVLAGATACGGTDIGGSTQSTGESGSASTSTAGDDDGAETTDTGGTTCALPTTPECAADGGYVAGEVVDGWLGEAPLTVIDTRSEAEFGAGHLPGAVNFDAASVRATVDGIAGQVADDATLSDVFSAGGVDLDTPVVVYGSEIETGAARVVWTLKYAGHRAPVYLLDGGFAAWSDAGRATESGTETPSATDFVVTPDAALRVDGAWVFDRLDDSQVTLVDVRSDTEYAAGHVPGALSVDWTTNVGPEGLFLAAPELLALYDMPAESQTLVVYCVSGSRASVGWVVLRALGFDDVRIYDGSWTEWSMNSAWPVETG